MSVSWRWVVAFLGAAFTGCPCSAAEYRWTATGPTTRIWILEATLSPASWQVLDWELVQSDEEISLSIQHQDGEEVQLRRSARDGSSTIEVQASSSDDARLVIQPQAL